MVDERSLDEKKLKERIAELEDENKQGMEKNRKLRNDLKEAVADNMYYEEKLSDLAEKVNIVFDKTKKDWSKEGRKINAIDFEILRQKVLKLLEAVR